MQNSNIIYLIELFGALSLPSYIWFNNYMKDFRLIILPHDNLSVVLVASNIITYSMEKNTVSV